MSMMKRLIYRFSVKQKMIIVFLTISMLGVITVARFADHYYTQATTDDFYKIARGSSLSLNHQIDQYFKQLIKSTSYVIAGPLAANRDPLNPNKESGAIQAWMTGQEPLSASSRLVIEDTLRRYIAINYSEIESIVLMKDNGEFISSNGYIRYAAEEPWVDLPFTDTVQVIPTYESYPYQISIVSLVIPVFSIENTNLVGRMIINLTLTEIKNIMEKTRIGETGNFFILSSTDTIVYHPLSNLIGKPLAETPLSYIDLSRDESIENDGMQDFLITYTASDFTDWRTVAVVPLQEMAAGLSAAQQSLLYVVIGLSFIVMAVIALLAKLLMEPVIKLKRVMYEVERGNLNVQVDYYPGKDELQVLNKSFSQMIQRLNELIENVYQYQLREMQLDVNQKDATIKALQAQINPHYLYNTLDIIRSMAFLEEVPKIEKIAGNLAAFYRYTAKLEPLEVTLEEEIAHLRQYLEIIELRFQQNFHSRIYVHEKFRHVRMVKLSLQPIVENAVKYSVEPSLGNAVIMVNAYDEGGDLILEVADNGPGIAKDKLTEIHLSLEQIDKRETWQSTRDSLGIVNVHARLRLQYGPGYGINVHSFPQRGTVVSIRIPYKKVNMDNES